MKIIDDLMDILNKDEKYLLSLLKFLIQSNTTELSNTSNNSFRQIKSRSLLQTTYTQLY